MRRHLRERHVLQALVSPKASAEPRSVLPSSIMPSKLTLRMLLAATLAALQLSASGAPLDVRTNRTADVEGSGEEQREEGEDTRNLPGGSNIFKIWERAIAPTKRHKEEFDKEFQGIVEYISLEEHMHSSFPNNCRSNFEKEACLQILAKGLLTYMVLLKHVEKEYPNNSIVTAVRASVPKLIQMIKSKMRSSEQVKAMTSSEEQQLLKELDDPDAFTRKMRAHSILCYLHFFLIDGERWFYRYEKLRNQAARANTTN